MAVRTEKTRVRKWVMRGYAIEATHVMIVRDTWDDEDYPVFVGGGEDIRERVGRFRKNLQQVIEVYSMKRDLNEQIKEAVAWHYDYPEEEVKTCDDKQQESVSGGDASG